MGRLAAHSGWQGSTSLSSHMEMILLVLLVCLPLLHTAEPQEMEFVVLSTSVHKEQSEPRLIDRNPYVYVGTSMQMLCRYRVSSKGKDYCAEKNSTRLTVHPVGDKKLDLGDKLVVIDNSSKCNLTVEFRNVSADMEGQYACTDEVANHSDLRNIRVGEAPVLPKNVSVVYWPTRSIALNLDPVKTGRDLNTPGTSWTVEYAWEDERYTKCHKNAKRCNSHLCQVCVIRLKKYSGCGHYTFFGIISGNISFRIKVRNIFGKVTVTKTFNLLDWVRPSAVEGLKVTDKNQSSLLVAVGSPKGLDETHYTLMDSSSHPMKLWMSVDLVSAHNQSLLLEEGQDFYKKYGFVRNLDDDQAALDPTLVVAFPTKVEEFLWKLNPEDLKKSICKRRTSTQYLPVGGLPFPGYYYNVCIQSFARYPGKKDCLEGYTQEAAPMEGPELHKNFAYCDHSMVSPKACGNCVIYFKEIPRSRRGSAKVNYTVTARLLNGRSLQHQDEKCTNSTTHFSEAQGQSNSVLILNLEVGGEYNITIQAHNAAGSSSVTSRILLVCTTPPPTAPRRIVLEKKYTASGQTELYELYWASTQPGHHKGVQHFVHYCNATSLQFHREIVHSFNQSWTPPEKNLDCVTNMVNKPVGDASTFNFEQKSHKALKAAFFVSTVTDDGLSSGLQKVGCFYTQNTVTEGVRSLMAQKVEHDTHALRVNFSLPCGEDLDYQYGRPSYYAVGMRKMRDSDDDFCEQQCSNLMQQTDYEGVPLLPTDNLNEAVKYELKDLEPGSTYCVGVNVAKHSMVFMENSWRCTVGRTAGNQSYASYVTEGVRSLMAQKVEHDTHALRVNFSLPCGEDLDYQYGCPNYYAVGRRKMRDSDDDICKQQCSSLMQQTDYEGVPLLPTDNLNEAVKYELKDLEPGSTYCVGVNVAKRSMRFMENSWRCTVGRTAESKDEIIPAIAGSSSIILLVLLCILCFLFRQCTKKEKSKFKIEKRDLQIPISEYFPVQLEGDKIPKPVCNGNVFTGHPTIPTSPGSGSSVVIRDGTDRYPLACPSSVQYPSVLPFIARDGGASDGTAGSEEANESGSEGDGEEDGEEDDKESGDPSDDGSSCAQEPLINGPSRYCKPQEQSRQPILHASTASHVERRPLLFDNRGGREYERDLSLSVEVGGEREQRTRPQALTHRICDTHQTNTIGQYSIDDILQAAESLPSTTTPDVGAAGGSETTAEPEPLLLENILRAADMCPWKGGADIGDGVAMHGAVGMSDHGSHGSLRDSACDSSIGTESVKETEAETRSLTGNS